MQRAGNKKGGIMFEYVKKAVKWLWRQKISFLAVIVVLAVAFYAYNLQKTLRRAEESLESRMDDIEFTVLDLESRTSDIEDSVSTLESNQSDLESRIDDSEWEIDEVKSRVDDIEWKLGL